MSEKIVKRNGNKDVRAKATINFSKVGSLQNDYRTCKQNLERVEEDVHHEKMKLQKASQSLEQAKEKLSQIQEEIDCDPLPEGAQPKARIQLRDNTQMNVIQLQTAYVAQKKVVDAKSLVLIDAERKLFQADRALGEFISTLDDAQTALNLQVELDKERATRLSKIESQRASRWEKEQQLAITSQARQMEDLYALGTKQIEDAKRGHKIATKRIQEASGLTNAMIDQLEQTRQARFEERSEAVLELKSNLDFVRAEVATQAAKHVNRELEKQRQLEQDKESLIEQGKNPYVEFRRKEFEDEARARERRLRKAVEENKADLAASLMQEDELRQREQNEKHRQEVYEQQHRAEQGRSLIEKRQEEYIKEITTNHADLLDPSGRSARVDPSQVTLLPDRSLGLGQSTRLSSQQRHAIVDKLNQQLGVDKDDVGEYKRLIPKNMDNEMQEKGSKKSRKGSQSPKKGAKTSARLTAKREDGKEELQEAPTEAEEDDEDDNEENNGVFKEMMGPSIKRQDIPGANGIAQHINASKENQELWKLTQEVSTLGVSSDRLEEEEEDYEDHEEEFKSLVNPNSSSKLPSKIKSKSGKAGSGSGNSTPANLSVFEQKALEKKREEQRLRRELGVPQVAAGRVFEGASFVSKPSQLIFQDFVVGQVYRQRFVLTNASFTFNSFQLLDLTDQYIDFFTLTYQRPGRMSAGVSCSLDIEFHPHLNQDIETEVKFLTETGPISIPLKCYIRRCAPRVQQTELSFGDVILGQVMTLPIQIKNTEAIGSNFQVSIQYNDMNQHDNHSHDSAPLKSAFRVPHESMEASAIRNHAPSFDDTIHDGESEHDFANPARLKSTSSEPMESEGDPFIPLFYSSCAESLADLQGRVQAVQTQIFRQKKTLDPLPFSVPIAEGRVEGYQDATVVIRCAPLQIGSLRARLVVHFDEVQEDLGREWNRFTCDPDGKLITQDQWVDLSVQVDDVPVYLGESTMNFRCTFYDRIYRQPLELKNRGKSAYRVNINVAKPFQKWLEVNPTLVFVQSQGSQTINLKFTPNLDHFDAVEGFSFPFENFKHASLLMIPIEIQVVNQELPLYFIVRSEVCESRLEVSTFHLNYGDIYNHQSLVLPITLTNPSLLAQKVGFLNPRKEITIDPQQGFAVLLPGESQVFHVSFCALSAIHYQFPLELASSTNDRYLFHVQAEAHETPVQISTASIVLRATGPGQRVVESFYIRYPESGNVNSLKTNGSGKSMNLHRHLLEIQSPPYELTFLKISPSVVELKPGQGARVEVEFIPPSDLPSVDPRKFIEGLKELSSSSSSVGSVTSSVPLIDDVEIDSGWVKSTSIWGEMLWTIPSETSSSSSSSTSETPLETEIEPENDLENLEEGKEEWKAPTNLPSEEWGLYGRWTVPIFFKSSVNPSLPPYFLSMETVVTLPLLEASTAVLDFGQMAVGNRLVKSFRLFHRSEQGPPSIMPGEPALSELPLISRALNAVGPFSLWKSLRPMPPLSSQVILIEACPPRPGLVQEILEIMAPPNIGGPKVQVRLKVQAIQPSLSWEGLLPRPAETRLLTPELGPVSVKGGILDFGQVVATDKMRRTFHLINESSFSLEVQLVRRATPGGPASPFQQAESWERNLKGLPIFTYRPEKVKIAAGAKQEIEVFFRPDRSRRLPFREDLEIRVGKSEESIYVGLMGRVWSRQMILRPLRPLDEVFCPEMTPSGRSVREVEVAGDVESSFSQHPSSEIRLQAEGSLSHWGWKWPETSPFVLEFPDPFASDALPTSYVELTGEEGSGGAGAKGKSNKGGGSGTSSSTSSAAKVGSRRQSRKVIIQSIKLEELGNVSPPTTTGKGGSANSGGGSPGTFELRLSPALINSGYFSLSPDKGNLAVGASMEVEILCTLPRPQGLGGLVVGSWQTFEAEAVLKGGWVPPGQNDEIKIPVLLKVFVSL